ncbi:MAG: hypothetical protein ACW99Q_18005 [Candidatus Kariarchaeaceae archaeon]
MSNPAITSEYESKVVCDGPCHVCKHKREKDVSTEGQDTIYYCRNCQEKYLCMDVLGRDRNSSEFLCPKCNSTMAEITVERAQQLGLAYGLRQMVSNIHSIDQLRKTWFFSSERTIISKEFVTDLINYELLETPQILDLLFHSDLRIESEDLVREKKALLWEIFSKKPNILKSIHNSLITQGQRKGDLTIRALVNYKSFGCVYASAIVPPSIAGTVDLIGIDQQGGLVWIIVQESRIDEQLVNSIMNEILSIQPLEFMGVERIIVLTQKWIWMAAEIARRQGRINTRWHKIQVELVEEDPLGNHKFI